jgi:hypothetical protein
MLSAEVDWTHTRTDATDECLTCLTKKDDVIHCNEPAWRLTTDDWRTAAVVVRLTIEMYNDSEIGGSNGSDCKKRSRGWSISQNEIYWDDGSTRISHGQVVPRSMWNLASWIASTSLSPSTWLKQKALRADGMLLEWWETAFLYVNCSEWMITFISVKQWIESWQHQGTISIGWSDWIALMW